MAAVGAGASPDRALAPLAGDPALGPAGIDSSVLGAQDRGGGAVGVVCAAAHDQFLPVILVNSSAMVRESYMACALPLGISRSLQPMSLA